MRLMQLCMGPDWSGSGNLDRKPCGFAPPHITLHTQLLEPTCTDSLTRAESGWETERSEVGAAIFVSCGTQSTTTWVYVRTSASPPRPKGQLARFSADQPRHSGCRSRST